MSKGFLEYEEGNGCGDRDSIFEEGGGEDGVDVNKRWRRRIVSSWPFKKAVRSKPPRLLWIRRCQQREEDWKAQQGDPEQYYVQGWN